MIAVAPAPAEVPVKVIERAGPGSRGNERQNRQRKCERDKASFGHEQLLGLRSRSSSQRVGTGEGGHLRVLMVSVVMLVGRREVEAGWGEFGSVTGVAPNREVGGSMRPFSSYGSAVPL